MSPLKYGMIACCLWSIAVGPCFGNEETMKPAKITFPSILIELKKHVKALTVSIGERSVFFPENLQKTVKYIESFYRDLDISVERQSYAYQDITAANVAARISTGPNPSKRYLVGAHYDSVYGTVGADDNASAVAVQLETARYVNEIMKAGGGDLSVTFVSFALEEPPVFGTRYMGSRVYARRARRENEPLDGMICLEMVGFTCHLPKCQKYPFPLNFMGYPEKGEFIGIVGNFKSREFTESLHRSFQKNPELPVIKLTVPFNGRIMPAIRLSDHASFWDKGYKAVMITDSAFYRNPNYHLPSDTPETLDYGFMAELVESLVLYFCDVTQQK
jgi:hypothetical protein